MGKMTVHVQRKGDGAYIRSVARDNLAYDIEGMPVIVRIEYNECYAVLGIPNAHTMRTLIAEFHSLVEDQL
jgi:hypothetical protein